jgi:hypothetical protein
LLSGDENDDPDTAFQMKSLKRLSCRIIAAFSQTMGNITGFYQYARSKKTASSLENLCFLPAAFQLA